MLSFHIFHAYAPWARIGSVHWWLLNSFIWQQQHEKFRVPGIVFDNSEWRVPGVVRAPLWRCHNSDLLAATVAFCMKLYPALGHTAG